MGGGGDNNTSRNSRTSQLGIGSGPEVIDEPMDECDVGFVVDLSGVRTAAAAALSVGDALAVLLRRSGGQEVVACVSPSSGAIVGTLANVRGLDRMIACLRSGRTYAARVVQAGSHSCRVSVGPTAT